MANHLVGDTSDTYDDRGGPCCSSPVGAPEGTATSAEKAWTYRRHFCGQIRAPVGNHRDLWNVRTGAPWRDLPERYGPWKTAHEQMRRWTADGTWDRR